MYKTFQWAVLYIVVGFYFISVWSGALSEIIMESLTSSIGDCAMSCNTALFRLFSIVFFVAAIQVEKAIVFTPRKSHEIMFM